MSEETKTAPESAPKKAAPEVEHPLSVLLFSGLRKDSAQKPIYYGMIAVCAALAVVGFFLHGEHHFELEGWPVFFGIFGFISFALAVLSGWPLGKALRRPEGFYEDAWDRAVKRARDGENPDAG